MIYKVTIYAHMSNLVKALLAGAAVIALSLSIPLANAAAPACTTTTTVASGGTATLSDLSGGSCVQVDDKIFGSASVGGTITGTGSAIFTITGLSVTVGFQGAVTSGTGNINYSVGVVNPTAFRIVSFQQDFTLSGSSADATLVGGIDVNLTCSRTTDAAGNLGPSTCPTEQAILPNLTSLSVSQTITIDTANTSVTAITDRINQVAVPEPGSLAMLGTGLAGLGGLLWWRRRRGEGGLAT